MPDIALNTKQLSLDQKNKIFSEAKPFSFNHWVDELDCKKSYRRRRIEMPWETIIEKLTDSSIFTVFHRKTSREHIEFCFSSREINGTEYFLWIQVEPQKCQNLLSKFNLEPT